MSLSHNSFIKESVHRVIEGIIINISHIRKHLIHNPNIDSAYNHKFSVFSFSVFKFSNSNFLNWAGFSPNQVYLRVSSSVISNLCSETQGYRFESESLAKWREELSGAIFQIMCKWSRWKWLRGVRFGLKLNKTYVHRYAKEP